MLAGMTASIFHEWYDHYVLEPWGYEIETFRHAETICTLANGLYHPKEPYKIKDFIPDFKPKKEQTWQEMKALMKSRSQPAE